MPAKFEVKLDGHPTAVFSEGDKFTDGEGKVHEIKCPETAWDAYKAKHGESVRRHRFETKDEVEGGKRVRRRVLIPHPAVPMVTTIKPSPEAMPAKAEAEPKPKAKPAKAE
jgi:hypothetical protein